MCDRQPQLGFGTWPPREEIGEKEKLDLTPADGLRNCMVRGLNLVVDRAMAGGLGHGQGKVIGENPSRGHRSTYCT